MRKLTLMISAFLIIGSLSDCNQSDKKEENVATKDTSKIDSTNAKNTDRNKILVDGSCDGVADLKVTQDEAKRMANDYDTIYIRESATSKRLSKDVWIDADVILALDDLLNKSTKDFDGVRFINSTVSSGSKTTINIVPTIARNPTVAGLSDHVNDFTPIVIGPGHHPTFDIYNRGVGGTALLKNRFDGLYITHSNNDFCLSTSIWMGECAIHALRAVIEAPNSEIDGVRVLFGAYADGSHPAPGQIAARQSTIILVPTKPTTDLGQFPDGHENDWNVIQDKILFTNIPKGGLNHGELCPNSCNANDDSKLHK